MAIDINTFKSTPVQQSVGTKPTETSSKPDSKIGTKTKVVIGTGLAALAAVGIYIATKGRGAKSIANNTPLKEITVNAFKESGNKFNKGKALLADGTTYTGKLIQATKDGKNIVMEYKDGLLQSSIKEGAFSKKYSYENGVLDSLEIMTEKLKTITGFNSDTKSPRRGFPIMKWVCDASTGVKLQQIQYDHQGKIFNVLDFDKAGNIAKFTCYHNGELSKISERSSKTGKTLKSTFFKDNKKIEVYDYNPETGNIIKSTYFDTEGNITQVYDYNPETGIRLKRTDFDTKGNISEEINYDAAGIMPIIL